MDKSSIAEVTFEKFVFGGDVLGRLPDGRVIFVPYGLPGETARVKVTKEKRNYAKGEIVELISASTDRITPRCQHFATCGGCSYQHISYQAQLDAKSTILREQLRGVLKSDESIIVHPAAEQWNYRNHIQFDVTSEGKLGFHRASSNEVIPIQECHLPEPSINAICPLIELEAGSNLERVSLRAGAGDEVQVSLEGYAGEIPEITIEGLPVSMVHESSDAVHVIAGSSYQFIEVLDKYFRVSAGSFFQQNSQMAGEMVKFILEQVFLDDKMTFLDLYCGVGLFSLFVAPHVGQLVGVEESALACDDFVYNLDAFDHVELYEDRVEPVLEGLDIRADVILVDPPRAGLHRKVASQILQLRPRLVVYVSCDPASLARDVRTLIEGGYVLEKIALFDQFPQTYHIESISVWKASV